MRRALSTSVLVGLILLAAGATAAEEAALPTFEEITEKAGIQFKHSYGDHHLNNIVETTGPGGMFFDFDSDGFQDIYLLNTCWQKGVSHNRGRDLRGKLFNALYRNKGDGTFEDVTKKAGVGHDGYGMGASAADYDADGDLDLYVLNYGPNVLYQNQGDGTFKDVSEASGLANPAWLDPATYKAPVWSLSAPWLDYDGDGDLDVYVANYLEYDEGKFKDVFAAAVFPGPLSYNGQRDALFRNNGDGTFTDVTEEAKLTDPDGRAMSAVATDLNNDGRADLYVTNDAMSNSYYVNAGDGTFVEEAFEYGLAFGEGGQGASSMGPVVGDVDRDKKLDVYIPDMGYGCMLVNRDDVFDDITSRSKLAVITGQYTGWGGGLIDYDNDGWLDVFVATGHPHREFVQEDVLARNGREGKFIDVAQESGPYFKEKHVGRGAAFADIDNDGDIDILVLNVNDSPRLLRNDGGNRNGWLTVVPRLESGSIALGTRVTVHVGEMEMITEVQGTKGYLSRSDPRAHFGLEHATQADAVVIRWPDGTVARRENVRANQFLEVVKKADAR